MAEETRARVPLPEDLARAVQALRDTPAFRGCTDSEIVRRLIRIALDPQDGAVREAER